MVMIWKLMDRNQRLEYIQETRDAGKVWRAIAEDCDSNTSTVYGYARRHLPDLFTKNGSSAADEVEVTPQLLLQEIQSLRQEVRLLQFGSVVSSTVPPPPPPTPPDDPHYRDYKLKKQRPQPIVANALVGVDPADALELRKELKERLEAIRLKNKE